MWRFKGMIHPDPKIPHQHTIMKQLPVRNIKARSGMTLIELTVVILVLLTLISILFVGAKAWKKGSDRAANVMNLRNVQQAVRGHSNMNDIPQADATVTPAIVGGAVTRVSIFGTNDDGVGGYLRFPAQIASVSYTTPSQINTATGTLYLVAAASGLEGAAYGPKSGSTRDW
jgi:prepilin-type N-terminal cleavage/methylation domain-containing protein